jgi:myb proto-oncogene protein
MSKKQRRWSPEEDAVLERETSQQMQSDCRRPPTSPSANAITEYDGTIKNWHEIAEKIPGRDNKDCRKRFYNEVTGGLRKVGVSPALLSDIQTQVFLQGPWMKEEDELLIACVEQYGQAWATIAQKVKTRSADRKHQPPSSSAQPHLTTRYRMFQAMAALP